MTEHVALQEDQIELPAAWAVKPLPRRSDPGEPPVLDPEGAKDIERFIRENEADIRHVLAQSGIPAAEALRHLDGEPDPVGAGVVTAIVSAREGNGQQSMLRPELDAWVTEHGLPFAVTATITRLGLRAWRGYKATMRDATLRPLVLRELGSIRWEVDRGIRDLRGLLAHASEADYAAAAAAALRGDPGERFLTTILFPDETAWTEEVCGEYKGHGTYNTDGLLWLTIDRADLLATAGLSRLEPWLINRETVGPILRNLGTDALPFLTASLHQQIASSERHLLIDAIALLPGDEAVSYLVGRLGEEHMYQAAAEAAKRFPRRVLQAVAAATDRTATELRPRLAALAADIPAEHRAVLTDAGRAAVEELLAPSPTPVADPAQLPQILTAPPWAVKGPKRKAKAIELSAAAVPTMAWAEGELDQWIKPEYDYFRNYTDADWEQMLDRGGVGRGAVRHNYSLMVTYAPTSFALRALERWDGRFNPYSHGDLKVIAARFGPVAAAKIVTALRANPNYHEALVPIRSVEAARLAADWYARLKGARAGAIAWFERHGGEGAALLVPDALGADKKLRSNAEGALWNIALRHGTDAVARAAEPYGPEAAEAIAELLAGDPLEPRGVKVPKPDAWASPAMLPEVLTAAKTHAIPAESVRHLITVLALSSPEYPYAGLDVVAEALDRDSLTRFSRGLFQLWLSMGSPSKDGWALTQLSHFADDDTVRLLAPLIREWPGQSQHKRAVNGLGVLGAIGSEAALRAIQGIAEKVKFKALKEEARVQIAAIAEGLGLTRDQLADRLLPDFGLGEEGALVLDYGPRRFTVVFDEQLKPFVKDETGKPRKSLPKPGAKDDAEIADAAYKRFAALKKELRTVAADQVQRLEAAMVNGRTWTKDEFERYYVRHPLTWHLARRLVWSAEAGGAVTGFRVAEDRTYTDADDDAFDLPDDAVIRLDHPVRLGDKAADWAELFADYEILQPFDQLSRPVLAFTPEELETGLLERFQGAKVEVGKLLGLTARGWHRSAPEDGGVEPGIYFPLPGGGYVTVSLDPGIWVGMIAENPIQTLDGVRISATEDYWWSRFGRAADGNHPRDIDPVTASEVLAALTRITAKD